LDENTLPPEAGLDQTHIDYHKGCYIGQEVISRLRSVGHVNRQLTGFVAEGDAPLAAGLRLFATAEDTTPIGVLTSAAYSFALEKPIALGYLKRGSPTGALLARLDGANGPPAVVTARALPFAS
jgi:folate-binding protein YgfZ